ncbi:MAG: glycine cleavage T C-terminal barrel domain-containing protein [Gemmatimonadota bacterium]
MNASPYDAARQGAVVVERPDRAVLRLYGRDPLRMLQGLVTADVAGAPEGSAIYAAMLTPKGKMLADLRVVRRAEDLLLEADTAAAGNIRDHLKRSVPPLFARQEDAPLEVLGVYGPEATRVLAEALGTELPADAAEGRVVELPAGALALHTRWTGDPGWDVLVGPARRATLRAELAKFGAVAATLDTLEVLRVEAGRPAWGRELTDAVIPLEADLLDAAISTSKGCYTGQEVIVRILHRGHVNRHLRGFLLGGAEPPTAGTAVLHPETGKAVGILTSAVRSPRHGQTIALGYLRRQLEPPVNVDVEGVSGDVTAVALPFPGDPGA